MRRRCCERAECAFARIAGDNDGLNPLEDRERLDRRGVDVEIAEDLDLHASHPFYDCSSPIDGDCVRYLMSHDSACCSPSRYSLDQVRAHLLSGSIITSCDVCTRERFPSIGRSQDLATRHGAGTNP